PTGETEDRADDGGAVRPLRRAAATRGRRGGHRGAARDRLPRRHDRPLRGARLLRPVGAPGLLMALYTRESIERVREAVDVVELELESEDPQAEERRRRRERLLALLERTARFYATYLWESGEAAQAREYLLGRGLQEEALREFRVGYSPSAWDRVVLAAQRD